jgi:hypothetical protein
MSTTSRLGDSVPVQTLADGHVIAIGGIARTYDLGIPTSTELLTNLDGLTGERRLRLAAAARSLPEFYAVLVVVTGFALIVNTSVVGARGGWRAALVTTSLTLVIALSVALFLLWPPRGEEPSR